MKFREKVSGYKNKVWAAGERQGWFLAAGAKKGFRETVTAGLIAGLSTSLLWAVVSIITAEAFSFLALLIGLHVGYVVKKVAKEESAKSGWLGAALTLFCCLIGVGLIVGHAFSRGLAFDPAGTLYFVSGEGIVGFYRANINFFTILFCFVTVYLGYWFAVERKDI